MDKAGQPTKYKEEYCEALVKHMAGGASYSTFGVDINVARKTLYNWEEEYPEWAEAKDLGLAAGLKFFETLLVNVTMGITPKSLLDVQSKGINLSAVIFALKTRFHKDYGEKIQTDHTSSDGSMKIEFVDPPKSDDKPTEEPTTEEK